MAGLITTGRLLITGSRDWDKPETIEKALAEVLRGWSNDVDVILVSGACPTGADAIAEKIWASWGGQIERHPANWSLFGKQAGFIRNGKMVDLGADLCLAFIKNFSKGATMTADMAEKKGIPTLRFLAA